MTEKSELNKTVTVNNYKRAYKLHLELNLYDADKAILKKWGKMEESISRDIIVSPNMTLHALHYAIQKCFGWENSHLHHFKFSDEDFDRLVENRLLNYLKFSGLYFRFYDADDDQELGDIYWDDDYEWGESFKTWLKRKYNPPYNYGGKSELYLESQMEARKFYASNQTVTVGPSFEEYMKGNTKNKQINIIDAPYEGVHEYYGCLSEELVEKASIGSMLRPLTEYEHMKFGILDLEESIQKALVIAEEYDRSFREDAYKYISICEIGEQYLDEVERIIKLEKKKNVDQITLLTCKENARKLEERYINGLDRILMKTERKMPPIASKLVYEYDYGDGWEVNITMVDDYRAGIKDGDVVCFYDKDGEEVNEELFMKLQKLVNDFKPICVAADGLPVMDDVGGISGYCEFLKGIHGIENYGPYDDIEESKMWARGMGWTGRMTRADRIL